MNPEEDMKQTTDQNDEPAYEPPRIESSLTPEDLAREVQYAGIVDNTLPQG